MRILFHFIPKEKHDYFKFVISLWLKKKKKHFYFNFIGFKHTFVDFLAIVVSLDLILKIFRPMHLQVSKNTKIWLLNVIRCYCHSNTKIISIKYLFFPFCSFAFFTQQIKNSFIFIEKLFKVSFYVINIRNFL